MGKTSSHTYWGHLSCTWMLGSMTSPTCHRAPFSSSEHSFTRAQLSTKPQLVWAGWGQTRAGYLSRRQQAGKGGCSL